MRWYWRVDIQFSLLKHISWHVIYINNRKLSITGTVLFQVLFMVKIICIMLFAIFYFICNKDAKAPVNGAAGAVLAQITGNKLY